MTLKALELMGIDAPPMNRSWYDMTPYQWGRDLLTWGERITDPIYNGDIIVRCAPAGFGVVWNGGFLHINERTASISWLPLSRINHLFSRTNGTSSRHSAFRKRNTTGSQTK
jgi:hypothetical protein